MKFNFKPKKNLTVILLSVLLLAGSCSNPEDNKHEIERDRREKIDWFTDARVGMMICWVPSCIYGKEMSWSRNGNPPDDWHSGGSIDSVLYDDSFKIFNPS